MSHKHSVTAATAAVPLLPQGVFAKVAEEKALGKGWRKGEAKGQGCHPTAVRLTLPPY